MFAVPPAIPRSDKPLAHTRLYRADPVLPTEPFSRKLRSELPIVFGRKRLQPVAFPPLWPGTMLLFSLIAASMIGWHYIIIWAETQPYFTASCRRNNPRWRLRPGRQMANIKMPPLCPYHAAWPTLRAKRFLYSYASLPGWYTLVATYPGTMPLT